MAAIAVVYAPKDRELVDTLIGPFPASGIDRWLPVDISRAALDLPGTASALATLVVLSPNSLPHGDAIAAVLGAVRTPVVIVRLEGVAVEDVPPLVNECPTSLWPRAAAASETVRTTAWQSIVDLLPAPPESSDLPNARASVIPWSVSVFSALLARAANRRDFERGSALISALRRHLQEETQPYPGEAAATDLGALRSQRLFILMRLYAEAVLRSGTSSIKARRQYAQALIELGEFDRALDVLDGVLQDAPPTDNEAYEARGLRGRIFKQQYVNYPNAPQAREWMARAIDEYWSVFRENTKHTWHGVNAASLIARANRDRIAGAPAIGQARSIAATVVDVLAGRQRQKEAEGSRLDEWDCASLVEARIILADITAAAQALDQYLAHPKMKAFEVSSTYRQFSEVLQLERDERCEPLLNRLWAGVKRHRCRGTFSDGVPTRMLLRVSDPEWSASLPDLQVHSQLGTVLCVGGSERTLKALMNDPRVVAIEESRSVQKGAGHDCDKSLPFIRVGASYVTQQETFGEEGDRALVAIIDDGVDLLHEAFLDEHGTSRVVGVWDQTDTTGPAPKGFAIGTYHDAARIAGYVAARQVPPGLTRNEAPPGVPGGHGTHVASIAAGRRTTSGFAGGVAPKAKLLVVIPASEQATGYSDAHVSALNFIDGIASDLRLPVVVNLSQGMNAGAHDGASGLEEAFDLFAGNRLKRGRVVVKSAGNEGDKAGHAEIPVLPGGGELLRWKCAYSPAFPERQRLELWWDSSDTYSFRLRSPHNQWSDVVNDANPEVRGRLGSGAKFDMTFTKSHVDNASSLLAIDFGDLTGLQAEGEWALDIAAGEIVSNTPIQAWFERHGAPPVFLNRYSTRMTLTVPGTARQVITVGAIDASQPAVPGQPSRNVYSGPFSSAGPTRDNRQKPDVAAPGVCVRAARSGTFTDAVAMDGTSMAAPHVTGAIALLLSKAVKSGRQLPTTNQIAALLRQTTRDYKGIWNDVQGFGVIDVTKLFARLDTILGPAIEPAATG